MTLDMNATRIYQIACPVPDPGDRRPRVRGGGVRRATWPRRARSCRRRAAMGDVHQRLRNDIVSGAFAFGSRLLIEELAVRYGVSHMPIREALRVLHGEGLVVIEPNRGAHVRPLYRGFIEDLFDVRAAIEMMLARRAAERRTSEHLARLREAAAKLEACVDGGRPRSRSRSPIASFTPSSTTRPAIPARSPSSTVTGCCSPPCSSAMAMATSGSRRVIDEHQHLIQAIERRDAHSASVLMGAHIERAKNNLLRRATETAAQVGVA